MVRLLLKIFLLYWIAAGTVIFITDFSRLTGHMQTPELNKALDDSLTMNGQILAAAYESGGCAATQRRLTGARAGLYLTSADGQVLCGEPNLPDAGKLIAAAGTQKKRIAENYARYQLIAVPVADTNYVLVMKDSYGTALQVYGLLPGYVTITISCVVTLFLAFLMALPIRQLRAAAGKIAMGKLDTRVRWNSPTARFTGGDDIDQLCRDFNHMAERLQSLADAQRLLLCEVSHELRSPLTRLSVGLSLARAESSPEMREHLDRIEAEAARLNHLIGQLLSLSRLDAFPRIEAPRTVSLSELVADLLPDMQYEATQVDCVIEAIVHPDCNVFGDEDLLRAAVENIVRNAIKYTGEGGLIQIETRRERGETEPVSLVRVSDNGPGIPEHELSSVLKPFYRADRSRHWQQEGSGIGLAIAERAVKLHEGAIDIRNRPGGGLSVEIRFPAERHPAAELAEALAG